MMGTKLTQMRLHGEVAELHPFALNTVAICWPSPATQERIDKALVFLAHPGNWLAGPPTPFSITHNLTVAKLRPILGEYPTWLCLRLNFTDYAREATTDLILGTTG